MLGGLSEALESGSRRGLRIQLLAVLVLALMPLLILSSVQGIIEYEQQREREIDRLHAAALTASEAITAAFSRADGKAGAIASQAFALMADPATCMTTLQRMAVHLCVRGYRQHLMRGSVLVNGFRPCATAQTAPIAM